MYHSLYISHCSPFYSLYMLCGYIQLFSTTVGFHQLMLLPLHSRQSSSRRFCAEFSLALLFTSYFYLIKLTSALSAPRSLCISLSKESLRVHLQTSANHLVHSDTEISLFVNESPCFRLISFWHVISFTTLNRSL